VSEEEPPGVGGHTYELDDPLAALASSSAKHSEMDLTLWKADSRVCHRESNTSMSALP